MGSAVLLPLSVLHLAERRLQRAARSRSRHVATGRLHSLHCTALHSLQQRWRGTWMQWAGLQHSLRRLVAGHRNSDRCSGQPSRLLAHLLSPLLLSSVRLLQMSAPKKLAGECKWFNSKKGFGFITPKDGSEEVGQTHTAQCSAVQRDDRTAPMTNDADDSPEREGAGSRCLFPCTRFPY